MDIKSLRSHKIFGLSIFDILLGMVGLVAVFLICWKVYFSNLNPCNFILAGIILTIPLGIIIHIFFGTDTTLNYNLGLSNDPNKKKLTLTS